ncbi:hypothetical protein M9H77_06802 [Catharanthus roseus]|uniref:Uncharacterized protein n=1 Tax=Catharanthus roseus TaxID=4058 RepID=A0ACC0BTE5_CATRO|nr:hypothetical protein M9H77_06802 [Catharanthus roseus]
MKQKINNLNISEELKDSLEKLFLESDAEELKDSLEKLFLESDASEDISSNSEIDHISNSSDESLEADTCLCKHNFSESEKENDEYYKLISQFQDSDINVLTNNHILEFLKSIKDPELRSRIIESLDDIPSTSSTTPPNKDVEFVSNTNPYSMSEVYKLMKQRYEESHKSPTTLKDLYGEINHLKDEIKII